MSIWQTNTFHTWDQRQSFTGLQAPNIRLDYNEKKDLNIHIQAPLMEVTPLNKPQGRLWQLWEHEVVEIFIAGENGHYLELEFGPWGHYLALTFSGIRQILDDACHLDHFSVEHSHHDQETPNHWISSSVIPRKYLPRLIKLTPQNSESPPSFAWRVNAFWCFSSSTIAQSASENLPNESRKLCCSSPLPGTQADFHQPQYFPLWFPDHSLN